MARIVEMHHNVLGHSVSSWHFCSGQVDEQADEPKLIGVTGGISSGQESRLQISLMLHVCVAVARRFYRRRHQPLLIIQIHNELTRVGDKTALKMSDDQL